MPHASSGSSLYTAKEICELALGKTGRFSVRDDAADQDDLKRAMLHFDLMLAHYGAIRPMLNLRRDEIEITLEEDEGTYNLRQHLNSVLPTGVQFAFTAMLEDSNGQRREIDIVTQREFGKIQIPTTSGTPCLVYIDRENDPDMRVYPIPGENEDGWKIILTVQTFSPTVKPRNVNRDTALTNQPTGLRAPWQLWAVERLAAIIGDGPVIKLPDPTIQRWTAQAALYERDLMSFENREHDSVPPFQQPSVYQ